ncbi:hypothetical protein C8J57DRAFT_1478350 [Mycena rebaudengoi]|nr:hypothetical protein C8J57DRAFT_1478350 [Mycena rebaudengoi]
MCQEVDYVNSIQGLLMVGLWWEVWINISQHTQTVANSYSTSPDFSKTSLLKTPLPMHFGGTILPPELERAVFEDAAFLDYKSIPRLALVAHRFYIWLEPLLYHVLVRWGGPVSRTIPHRLRDIMDGTSPGSTDFVFLEIPKMLSVCSGANDLAFFSRVEPSLIPHLDRIRPTRLRINIRQLSDGSADFCRSMFTNISHLAFTDSIISHDESWKSLASLPCLTHLSFDPYHYRRTRNFLHAVLNQDGWVAAAWERAGVWVQADYFIRMKRTHGDYPDDYCFMDYDEYCNWRNFV